jgi:hypothetical protein
MFYLHLGKYTALVTYLGSVLPLFRVSYEADKRWLYVKFLTFEISAHPRHVDDGWRTVH